MLEKVTNISLTATEAAGKYPDKYILMSSDSIMSAGVTGTVFAVGDEENELYPLLRELKNVYRIGIIEGLNRRDWIGGVVLNG
jgi:hypothetical protein